MMNLKLCPNRLFQALIIVIIVFFAITSIPVPAMAWLTFVEDYRDGNGGVDGLDMAFAASVSPDGKHVYTVGFLDDAVSVFSRETDTGELNYVTCYKNGPAVSNSLNGPEHLTVSPDGKHVYVAVYLTSCLTVFRRDEATGELAFIESHKDNQGGVDGLAFVQYLVVSQDGKHVYAAATEDNAISMFTRNENTGALTYVACYKDGVDSVDGLDHATSVAVSPDGKHVYATGRDDDAVAVFSRDLATGELTYITCYKDDLDGVDGLNGACGVSISRCGKHVYAVGSSDDALSVFNRNSDTGELTYITCYKNGAAGVDGLNGAYAVNISRYGNRVYVTGDLDGSLAVFKRDKFTGELAYSECFKDNLDVPRLNQPRFPVVSPNDESIYVPSSGEDALSFFRAPPVHILTVDKTGFGSGTVTANPSGIDCGDQCSDGCENGTIVTLTAIPDAVSVFEGWSGGGCTGAGDCTVTMDQARNVNANFRLDVSTESPGGGCFLNTLD